MMEQLQRIFIRPSRHFYSIKDLGPCRLTVNEREVFRKDVKLLNKNNQKLELSCYLFDGLELTNEIIVYLHCNSGSRMEGLNYHKAALENGYPFVVFDFAGSGISEGEYVTLGLNQSEDIKTVVEYLKGCNQNIKIALWGRSMGAVASLLYLVKNHKMIEVAVYDSPFSSLKQLALDIGSDQTNFPKFLVEGFMKFFNNRLKEKTKLDLLNQLDIGSIVQKIPTPGLFLGSKCDKLIHFKHIEELYCKYSGYKQIFYLDQDHHEKRKPQAINYIMKFIKRQMMENTRIHKKSTSNLISLTNTMLRNNNNNNENTLNHNSMNPKAKKHSYSQVEFRNLNEKTHKEYFDKANKEIQKRKFIYLTDPRKYESTKILKIQPSNSLKINTDLQNKDQSQKQGNRQPIKLCKNRIPLSEIKIDS